MLRGLQVPSCCSMTCEVKESNCKLWQIQGTETKLGCFFVLFWFFRKPKEISPLDAVNDTLPIWEFVLGLHGLCKSKCYRFIMIYLNYNELMIYLVIKIS